MGGSVGMADPTAHGALEVRPDSWRSRDESRPGPRGPVRGPPRAPCAARRRAARGCRAPGAAGTVGARGHLGAVEVADRVGACVGLRAQRRGSSPGSAASAGPALAAPRSRR
jgi:hypothetical protein